MVGHLKLSQEKSLRRNNLIDELKASGNSHEYTVRDAGSNVIHLYTKTIQRGLKMNEADQRLFIMKLNSSNALRNFLLFCIAVFLFLILIYFYILVETIKTVCLDIHDMQVVEKIVNIQKSE